MCLINVLHAGVHTGFSGRFAMQINCTSDEPTISAAPFQSFLFFKEKLHFFLEENHLFTSQMSTKEWIFKNNHAFLYIQKQWCGPKGDTLIGNKQMMTVKST